ncbi:MAG: hypothetical protein D3920_16690, partial [Candidatus Electrothrix sp. AW2]|nr:hypothetical protein [Candidatus Electrothrix gigas]
TGLPNAQYLVVVNENDSDFPGGQQTSDPDEDGTLTGDVDTDTTICTVCDGRAVVDATSGGIDEESIDFGYQPVGGMLGDTIYWDANGDGSQGQFEQGIADVEVTLHVFTDANKNGRYDVGESYNATPYKTAITDANGNYLFYGLPDDPNDIQNNYLIKVGSITGNPQLTADPGADGAVCPAAGSMCDGIHGVAINGNSYMGADFGYQPPGVIGDQLFIDRDRSGGPMDGNDAPIPYVTVTLKDYGPDGALGGGDDGPDQVTQTDDAGQYSFINLTVGNTYVITVDTVDSDFPSHLDPATYNGAAGDASTDNTSTVVATAESIRNVDFGYPLQDANDLSGTVCLETTVNGVCGSGTSGVDSGETAYNGTSVYVSKWTDTNADNIIDAGELTFLTQTVTAANGDYTFNGLPSVSGANESYLVSLNSPEDYIKLTTTASVTPADLLTENNDPDPATDYTLSAWQRIPAGDGSNPTGVDFAFKETVNFDYGD